jgi:membrane protease YdiL (CAAX protease family)
MISTSVLAGILEFGRTATDGPWPEAVRVTSLALCGGFTYAALRWRTASLWPVILVHAAFAFAVDIATLGAITYRITLVLSTLGFVAYGVFLLRNREARADGGLAPEPKPARVR